MSNDPTLNHEAVKLYRDQFKFCPKIGLREDIISTVQDMALWKTILSNWGYWKENKWIKHNPLNVKGMMSEYERREKHTNRSVRVDASSSKREGIQERVQVGLPERRDTPLSRLPERTTFRFRRRDPTLDDILAQAVRKVSGQR